MGKARISVIGEVPERLLQAFIQHLRDFDTRHSDCAFRFDIVADSLSTDEVERIMASIDPPFEFRATIPLRKN